MSPEDLQQIQAIVTAAVTAAEQRINGRMDALNTDLTNRMGALEVRLTQRQDAAMEAFAANLSDLRNEMNSRFDKADARFGAVDRRTERMEVHLQSIIMQTAGMNKSLTDAERLDSAFAAAQSAQQRAIDDLAARVAKLEREIRNPPTRN